MKLSDKERLFLVEKKEAILSLTNEIIECINNKPNKILVINDINKITSYLSIIASYTDSKSHNLGDFNRLTYNLISQIEYFDDKIFQGVLNMQINLWCNITNSIQFKFTEDKAIIKIPNIDINILKQSLSGIKTGIDI
jgi:hypothetical protein